jgi:hypothetical protein
MTIGLGGKEGWLRAMDSQPICWHVAKTWRIIYAFLLTVAYPGIISGGGGSANSVEDRVQTERGSGGGSPLVTDSAIFANEWNPYSD